MPLLDSVRQSLWTLSQFRGSRSSPARLAAVQDARLRKLLRHAVRHSAFYREKFRGLDVDRCPLAALPVTTKGEVMARWDDVVTDPAVRREGLERFVEDPDNVGKLYLDKYPVCHTSGSTGQSLLIVQNRLTLDLLFAFHMTRGNVDYRRLGLVEAARRVFAPGRLAVVINRPGFFPSAWVWQHLPPGLRHFLKLLYIPGSAPDLAAQLAAFRPTALAGTPSGLELLALRPDRPRLPGVRQVSVVSETLTPPARARIEAAFGVPVMDSYGCGECLFLSNGCPTGPGGHVNADWAVVEVVDELNRPVPARTPGAKVLLTNLANDVQPFIRYEVGDRVVMGSGPCACGSRLPKFERVDGRSSEFFWVRGAAGYRPLTIYPFLHALDHFRQVREWQAVQADRNRVTVRLELLPGATLDEGRVRKRIGDRLETVGLRDAVDVDVELVPKLDWDTRTGKFRRLLSEVGPPEDLGANQPRGVRELAAV